ncbi:pilus assembly PilX N-terminal domain-containing protein [Ruminiclostridium josui]|uniref:pilus assembly PilX N-terminal domain-containing protein n=1 Tax=Ruminiclostridium josui TaxID=1499 RepID=UPI000463454D|nr:pilus assembly PilX N-terminal domain-containing protein [Ruminiclostridium josui]
MCKIRGYFKNSNGSSLAMVLFLVFVLSATALAVMALTGSELVMSTVTSDRSKALFAAQAGAEKVAQKLDTQVGKIQDEARVTSSQVIKKAIDDRLPVFNEIIDTTDSNNIKVLKEKELNDIYEAEYKYQFFKLLLDWIEQQTAAGGEWDSTITHGVQHIVTKEGKDVIINDGSFFYSLIRPNKSEKFYSSIVDTTLQINEISSITVKSTGEYKSGKYTYKRSILAEFSLLTESVNDNSEIPIIYSKLTKVKVNKDNKPEILKNKAIVARKNIISVSGTVNIEKGNAICFGYIPTTNGTDIDYNADGYKYGGFMAGMTRDTWNDTNLGHDNKSIKNSIIDAIPSMSDFDFTNLPGSFNIQEGNAITAAYIHTLYSNANSPSKINIQKGDVYARSVKVENKAHSSEVNLKNVILTDDLRIDSNNSTVNIGKWDGGEAGEGMIVGLNPGDSASGYDTSSAVIVSGDSNLNINGSLYIGGTTYFNEYKNITDNKMYFSGISVLKSGSLPAEAFRMWDDIEVPSKEEFPGNIFYLFDNTRDKNGVPDADDYIYVNDPIEQQKLISAGFNYKSKNESQSDESTTVQMMMGSQTRPLFNILDRAMHFKWIWDNFWKDDVGYYSYLNSGDIKIAYYEKDSDGNDIRKTDKVKGWCFGAVAANDTVYGPYGGFTETGNEQYYIEKGMRSLLYRNNMNLFVQEFEQVMDVKPAKSLTDNGSASEKKGLINTEVRPDEIVVSKSGIFLLNSSHNVVLSGGQVNSVDIPREDGYLQGIIYSAGDIYVGAGTKFKGILIAEGNIVFLGGADISYDENVVDILLSEEPDAGRLFNYNASEIILSNSSIKTIKKPNVKNIKITSWKEEK